MFITDKRLFNTDEYFFKHKQPYNPSLSRLPYYTFRFRFSIAKKTEAEKIKSKKYEYKSKLIRSSLRS